MKIKILTIFLSVGVLFLTSCSDKFGKTVKLNNELDSVSYALGASVGSGIAQGGVTEINEKAFMAAFKTALAEDSLKIDPMNANRIISMFMQKSMQKMNAIKSEKNKEEGAKFLEENKSKEEVITLESGLQYKILKQGTGKTPGIEEKVKCHYHGTLIDGTVFDSSVERGKPVEFPVKGVIKGWTEALQLMPVGSKWKLFIPSELAYGARGAGKVIGPDATLVFEVELLDIVSATPSKK